MEGKDLKSKCNSCGTKNSHDGTHKAGKALINHLKQGGGQIVDITSKDKVGHNDDEGVSAEKSKKDRKDKRKGKGEEEVASPEKLEEKADKKEKKDKKDKKKKKAKDDTESDKEAEDSMSDDGDEITWESRRISK